MATDMNSVTVVGRLTRDAELKYSQGGMAIAPFSIANNYRKKSGESWADEVNYFDVTYSGKAAEAVSKYLTKGKQVGVEGVLRQNRWQNKEGENRSKIEILANSVQLLGGEKSERSEPQSLAQSADFKDDVPF